VDAAATLGGHAGHAGRMRRRRWAARVDPRGAAYYLFQAMTETEMMLRELEQYKSEKERVRRIIGQIGGSTSKRKDLLINLAFLLLVVGLFALDIVREVYGVALHGIPPFLSMELAVVLVSLKIIWMIYRQTKVDHFQFWVLNSIEFQINLISQRLRELESRLERGELVGPPGQRSGAEEP
jgi:hypothetical protein